MTEVWSGGQFDVDVVAWDTALTNFYGTGGWMPRGFWTEKGRMPEFAELYGAKECTEGSTFAANLAIRNEWNVRDSDWMLIFHKGNPSEPLSKGTQRSIKAANRFGKPEPLVIFETTIMRPERVAEWIAGKHIARLNVGGNRSSDAPNLGKYAGTFLKEVFRTLRGT
jgi:hypothetical protein